MKTTVGEKIVPDFDRKVVKRHFYKNGLTIIIFCLKPTIMAIKKIYS